MRRMTKNINNHAINTATMDPRISQVIVGDEDGVRGAPRRAYRRIEVGQ